MIAALFFGGAFFLTAPCLAQDNVLELLDGSDEMRLDGNGNYIVNGNVVFQKGNAKLYCDSAFYNIITKEIRAYRNVHINKQDTLNLFCDSLFYDSEADYAKLWGNVRVRDNEFKLTTDSLDYDIGKDEGIYTNYGKIVSITGSDELESKIGYFYPDKEQFNFRENVVYKSNDYTVETDTLQFNGRSKKAFFFGPTSITGNASTMYCESGWYHLDDDVGVLQKNARIDRKDLSIAGDSLYYSSKDSLYIGEGNVVIEDTTNQLGFSGDYAKNEGRKNQSFITGHALGKRYGDEDTLYIHADTLFSTTDSTGAAKRMKAYREVEIFRGELQGICDSLSYDREEGIMNLYNDPILWAKDAQLSGDTISVYSKDDQIQRAFLRKKGIVVTHVKRTSYYNQVAGKTMNAYFDSSKIKRLDIESNAKTIYFLEDETENDSTIIVERKGMNRIYSADISLYFQDGDIRSATYRSEPDGVLYPMNQIKKDEERVSHFQWKHDLRPPSVEFMVLNEKAKNQWRELLLWYLEWNGVQQSSGAPAPEITQKEEE